MPGRFAGSACNTRARGCPVAGHVAREIAVKWGHFSLRAGRYAPCGGAWAATSTARVRTAHLHSSYRQTVQARARTVHGRSSAPARPEQLAAQTANARVTTCATTLGGRRKQPPERSVYSAT